MRYQTIRTGNKTIVVSHYAGRAVKGYAKCNPADTFDQERGEKLAKLRCDEKICEKRVRRARLKLAEAHEAFVAAARRLTAMQSYLKESEEDLKNIQNEKTAFENIL